jgi:hypothetical protein
MLDHQELPCAKSGCTSKVTYDANDSRHRTVGAALKDKTPVGPIIVYLTCSEGHTRRYEIAR